MVKQLIPIILAFYFGYKIGTHTITKKIEQKLVRLITMEKAIKQQNNQMVQNFAEIYGMSDHDPSKFTEIDALLSSMWMD
jgi:hypothetical protein